MKALVTSENEKFSVEEVRLDPPKAGELKIKMGSPGSAQVTRCRLLAEWSNLEATTKGATLLLRLPGGRK